MGYLIHGAREYEFDDRVLAHLQYVVVSRLRRKESFLLSWNGHFDRSSGRVSLWLSPDMTVTFRYSGSRAVKMNAVWVRALEYLAHSGMGMRLIPEADAERVLSTVEEPL